MSATHDNKRERRSGASKVRRKPHIHRLDAGSQPCAHFLVHPPTAFTNNLTSAKSRTTPARFHTSTITATPLASRTHHFRARKRRPRPFHRDTTVAALSRSAGWTDLGVIIRAYCRYIPLHVVSPLRQPDAVGPSAPAA